LQVAELSYWKQQAVSRYDGLERDNQGLRKRVAELLRLGEKRSKSGEAHCCSWLGTPGSRLRKHTSMSQSEQ
jgi:hypothetical protein